MMGLLERAVWIAATTSLAGVLLAWALLPAIPLLRALPPRVRVVLIEGIVILPWLAPIAILGAALAPSVLAAFWPALDHCHIHDDHHEHLCLAHPPAPLPLSLSTLLALLVLGALAMRTLAVVPRLSRAHATVRRLLRSATREEDGTWSVPTNVPLVAVVGALRPKILVSEGARAQVSRDALAVALAHERAHVSRADVARGVVIALASAAHPAAVAASWAGELTLGREQVCDEAAADAVGDRVLVAEAILEVVRALGDVRWLPAQGSLSFGADALAARVESLLQARPTTSRAAAGLMALAGLAAVAALPAVHHGLESLLELLH